jgi:AcrR family transcriptional regulator
LYGSASTTLPFVTDRKKAILDAAIAVIARKGVRGLRVEEVAAAAGVAVSLLYYYFGTRDGLVRATLDHANERAATVPDRGDGASSGYEAVERILIGELDEAPAVRESSVVWGEVLASAVFERDLREQLRAANTTWVELVADRIRAGQADGSIRNDGDAEDSAERLTALVDGLSARWLAGLIDHGRACELLRSAIAGELRADAVADRA